VTADGMPFSAVRNDMGVTQGPDCAAALRILVACLRVRFGNGRVIGTYVHGLFADDRQRSAWLQRLGADRRQCLR